MKTVRIQWSETLYYNSFVQVPDDATEDDAVDVFYNMDLDSVSPIDNSGIDILSVEVVDE